MRLSEFTIEMFVHVIVVTVQADKGQQHIDTSMSVDLVYKKYISRLVIVSSKHNSGSWYVSDKKEYGCTYFYYRDRVRRGTSAATRDRGESDEAIHRKNLIGQRHPLRRPWTSKTNNSELRSWILR